MFPSGYHGNEDGGCRRGQGVGGEKEAARDENICLLTSPHLSHTWVLQKKKVKYWLGGGLEPSAGINFIEKDVARSTIMYPEQLIWNGCNNWLFFWKKKKRKKTAELQQEVKGGLLWKKLRKQRGGRWPALWHGSFVFRVAQTPGDQQS